MNNSNGNGKNPIEDAIINASGKFNAPSSENITRAVIGLIILFVIVSGAMSSFYKVGTEETAVILRFGKFLNTASSGLHFKLPFGIDRVYLVKTGRILKEEFGFRSIKPGIKTIYKKEGFDDESLVLTGDLNVSDLEWIVQYKIQDPFKFLFNIHDPKTTIRDVSEAMTRKVVGDSNVTAVLTTDRPILAEKIHREMQKILNSYDIGVKIVTVKFQDVNPPESVKAAFNGVNEAEQQKESLIQQAREQYNREVPKARGEAKQMIQEAEGYALERVNRAEGDAKKFLAVYEQYRKFPEVTRKRMYLETMEKVLPKIKEIWVIDQKGEKTGQLTPILPLQPIAGGEK
ncbi:MAG: FtsH protease activity modulator HflK [Candidatus Rifleibacteriota bacterium]